MVRKARKEVGDVSAVGEALCRRVKCILSSSELWPRKRMKPQVKEAIRSKEENHSCHDLLIGGRRKTAERRAALRAVRPCGSSLGRRSFVTAVGLWPHGSFDASASSGST